MIGQTLGHYKIVEKLGEGGMGVVRNKYQMTKSRRRQCLGLITLTLVSVLLRANIYLMFRSTDLVVFTWLDTVGSGGINSRFEFP